MIKFWIESKLINIFSIETVFDILIFWEIKHQFAKKFVKNELLQIVQTIIVFEKRFFQSIFIRKTRAVVTITVIYLSEWVIDKKTFRETLIDFWNNTETYRIIRQFHNFQSKIESVSNFSVFFLFLVQMPDFSEEIIERMHLNITNQFKTFHQDQNEKSSKIVSNHQFFKFEMIDNQSQFSKFGIIESRFLNSQVRPQFTDVSKSGHKQLNLFTKNSNSSNQFLKRLVIINSIILNQKEIFSDKFSKYFVFFIKRFHKFHFFFHNFRTNISDRNRIRKN